MVRTFYLLKIIPHVFPIALYLFVYVLLVVTLKILPDSLEKLGIDGIDLSKNSDKLWQT